MMARRYWAYIYLWACVGDEEQGWPYRWTSWEEIIYKDVGRTREFECDRDQGVGEFENEKRKRPTTQGDRHSRDMCKQ